METLILYLFVYILEAFLLWWYMSNLFSSIYSRKTICINLSIGYTFLYLVSIAESFFLNTVLFTAINFIFILIFYNVKWSIALFHSLMITSIMGLSEIIISILFSSFNEITVYAKPDITLLILVAVLSKLLYFIGLKIAMVLIPRSASKHNYTNKITSLLNIIPFISFYIVVILYAILLNINISQLFRYMLSSCAVLLLFINILIFYIYYHIQQKNKEFTELQIQLQKEYDMTEYYKSLFRQNENQQILIHDIRNHLLYISQLNEQNEKDKVSRYLYALLNSSDLQNSVHVSDNELLNSILCHYINICRNKHISFKVDARKKYYKLWNILT